MCFLEKKRNQPKSSAILFHFAKECTTSALSGGRAWISKLTAFSVPVRESLSPLSAATKRGTSIFSRDKKCSSCFSKLLLTNWIACWVDLRSKHER
ncbi:hypothetical protein BSK20_01005 [SR1 bacterium human oral taxon HOT-345]|nr:hypothetical protein BSK20_01005 [SR1 bacterium human oral taxon HOT-345]